MKLIGGFFELELSNKTSESYHKDALALSYGRACLSLILTELKPRKVYVPFYCCDSVLESFFAQNIAFEFYAVDINLELANPVNLKSNEYIRLILSPTL